MATAKKNYGDVTPDSAPPPTGRSISRSWTAGRWLAIGLAAILLGGTGILALRACDQRPTGQRLSVHVAHGPVRTLGGVPIGYSQDQQGAATAAVNVLQALTQAGQGRLPIESVTTALVARDPGPDLRTTLRVGANRPAEHIGVVNLIPAAVTVTGFSALSARVSVWMLAISRAGITDRDPVSVLTAWSTHFVDLTWENGDWKVKNTTSTVGPLPEKVTAPGADSLLAHQVQPGQYTFYLD
ncbi:hypothetical protein [Nocardia aurantia]|uniref:DUF8175 domain-containing protein n=1 Tax=Nocardia aurantia TaxID=2585199 RepID=A0A7K0DT29_9NOCA|nr:hypothetical protein [Nocardia aurantia]MQY28911.1 hypothetical protein [Nocardia aurantia]